MWPDDIVELSNDELKRLMDKEPQLQIIDVRTEPEYTQLGHISGARLFPIQTLPEDYGKIDPERPTVVLCEHGVRSANATLYLARQGFSSLYNLTAGMAEWDGPRDYSPPSP